MRICNKGGSIQVPTYGVRIEERSGVLLKNDDSYFRQASRINMLGLHRRRGSLGFISSGVSQECENSGEAPTTARVIM